MKRSFPTIRLLPADEQLAAEFNAAVAADRARVLARLQKAMQAPMDDEQSEELLHQAKNYFQKGDYHRCERDLIILGF